MPGISVTTAFVFPQRVFRSVLLPAFGGPAIITVERRMRNFAIAVSFRICWVWAFIFSRLSEFMSSSQFWAVWFRPFSIWFAISFVPVSVCALGKFSFASMAMELRFLSAERVLASSWSAEIIFALLDFKSLTIFSTMIGLPWGWMAKLFSSRQAIATWSMMVFCFFIVPTRIFPGFSCGVFLESGEKIFLIIFSAELPCSWIVAMGPVAFAVITAA